MKIQFESSTACNANCVFCPNHDITRPRGEMTDELFHKIIKEGKEIRNSFFVPFLNGEPFAFPRIWEWLDYMRDEKVRVHIYTNAEHVDVDRLVSYPNISVICCGVNAATKKTYDRVVRGPKYSVVEKNAKELIEKSKYARVFASMVVVDENLDEIKAFMEKWGENAIFGDFKNWGGDKHNPIEETGFRVPCIALLKAMSILWDGRVVSCCLDYDGKQILGDANKQSLTEIWHASHWLRQAHRHLDFSMEPCKNCNHNI